MFLGVDHGTRAIRFADSEGKCRVIPREEAGGLDPSEIIDRIREAFDLSAGGEVDLIALCYSMGDGLTEIVRIEDAENRGVISQEGAGLHVGGGTKVFDAVRESGWPAILLPGIHDRSDIDPRMKVFSHGTSPEKVGLAYKVFKDGEKDFIISDASSNVVTIGVADGRIAGAIDAPIFAPGLLHGPLDVAAIRNVDAGKMTANEAFTRGGILRKRGLTIKGCTEEEKEAAFEALALYAAMELAAMAVLLRDHGAAKPALYLAGDPASRIAGRVSQLLGGEVLPLASCDAALGCALIAEDVYGGAREVLGLRVDGRV
ncbi:methanogenesis marker 12 protein [Methanocrinis sp.]|uniref:methanogenesis marker 12 protein n=1 Tax=Methanocrinis sp. TaxID=3101522 RepID=UPI003D10CEC1